MSSDNNDIINILIVSDINSVYNNYQDRVSKVDFDFLLRLDPTYQGGNQAGKYYRLILDKFLKSEGLENIKQQANYITELLNRLEAVKNILSPEDKNTLNIKNITALEDLVSRYEFMNQGDVKVQKTAKGLDIKYQDKNWVIFVPKVYQDYIKYAQNSKWCTKAQTTFIKYSSVGTLIVIYNKRDEGKSFQVYVADKGNEFKDFKNVPLSAGSLEELSGSLGGEAREVLISLGIKGFNIDVAAFAKQQEELYKKALNDSNKILDFLDGNLPSVLGSSGGESRLRGYNQLESISMDDLQDDVVEEIQEKLRESFDDEFERLSGDIFDEIISYPDHYGMVIDYDEDGELLDEDKITEKAQELASKGVFENKERYFNDMVVRDFSKGSVLESIFRSKYRDSDFFKNEYFRRIVDVFTRGDSSMGREFRDYIIRPIESAVFKEFTNSFSKEQVVSSSNLNNIITKAKQLIKQSILDPIKEDLNPTIWNPDKTIRADVKNFVLDLLSDWVEQVGDGFGTVKGVYVQGSNTGYQYTDTSDLDIHLDLDISDEQRQELNKMLPNGNLLLETKHPVNFFVLDADNKFSTQGPTYDLVNDTWVIEPNKESVKTPFSYIMEIAKLFMVGIDDRIHEYERDKQELELYKQYQKDGSVYEVDIQDLEKKMEWKEYEVFADLDSLRVMKDLLYSFRSGGYGKDVEKAGKTEFLIKDELGGGSVQNQVYKTLEKFGYIDKLREYLKERDEVKEDMNIVESKKYEKALFQQLLVNKVLDTDKEVINGAEVDENTRHDEFLTKLRDIVDKSGFDYNKAMEQADKALAQALMSVNNSRLTFVKSSIVDTYKLSKNPKTVGMVDNILDSFFRVDELKSGGIYDSFKKDLDKLFSNFFLATDKEGVGNNRYAKMYKDNVLQFRGAYKKYIKTFGTDTQTGKTIDPFGSIGMMESLSNALLDIEMKYEDISESGITNFIGIGRSSKPDFYTFMIRKLTRGGQIKGVEALINAQHILRVLYRVIFKLNNDSRLRSKVNLDSFVDVLVAKTKKLDNLIVNKTLFKYGVPLSLLDWSVDLIEEARSLSGIMTTIVEGNVLGQANKSFIRKKKNYRGANVTGYKEFAKIKDINMPSSITSAEDMDELLKIMQADKNIEGDFNDYVDTVADDLNVTGKDIKKGMEVEKEHSNDKLEQLRISIAHFREPGGENYYNELDEMEEDLKEDNKEKIESKVRKFYLEEEVGEGENLQGIDEIIELLSLKCKGKEDGQVAQEDDVARNGVEMMQPTQTKIENGELFTDITNPETMEHIKKFLLQK